MIQFGKIGDSFATFEIEIYCLDMYKFKKQGEKITIFFRLQYVKAFCHWKYIFNNSLVKFEILSIVDLVLVAIHFHIMKVNWWSEETVYLADQL